MPERGLAFIWGCSLWVLSPALWAFGSAHGIEGFRVLDPARYQVFSERGKGAFNLIGQRGTLHRVCFFYGTEKPFRQLQGVTIAAATPEGDKPLDFTISNGCVEFRFDDDENLPLQIEFSDLRRSVP